MYRKHYQQPTKTPRYEVVLDFALAVAIGAGLAYFLAAWWSA